MAPILRDPWFWVSGLAILTAVTLFLGSVVVASVEIAIARRLKEIESMFGKALDHGRSFDGLMGKVRLDLANHEERLAAATSVLSVHGEAISDMESRLRVVESRPGLLLARDAEGPGTS